LRPSFVSPTSSSVDFVAGKISDVITPPPVSGVVAR
jgi:hypothetical protein